MTPDTLVKPDWADAKARIEAWWAGSSIGGRPAVAHVRLPKPNAAPAPSDPRPRAVYERDPAWQAAMACWTIENHEFPAETVPGVYPFIGSNLMVPATLAGGRPEYAPDTTWLKEEPGILDRPIPAFSPDMPDFQMLDGHLRAMAAAIGRRALLSPPVLLDGLTTLSLFRGPQPLCMDLLERPEQVKAAARGLEALALAAHAAWWRTLEGLGQAQTITWAGIYAPGKCEMVQSDFSVMLSPEMFEEFTLPNLQRATEYFDYSCYHLDGTGQCRFLDLLCSLPRLRAIQWNPEPGAGSPVAWLDFFRKVRRCGRSLWVVCPTVEEAVKLTHALGPDGLMLVLRSPKSLAEMDAALEELTM